MPKIEYTKQGNLTFWDSPDLPILKTLDELIKLGQAHFCVHAQCLLTIAGGSYLNSLFGVCWNWKWGEPGFLNEDPRFL